MQSAYFKPFLSRRPKNDIPTSYNRKNKFKQYNRIPVCLTYRPLLFG